MKFSTLAAAAAFALAGVSAPALAAPTAGATVYGPAGTAVGTIESVASDHAVLNTGSVKAALPLDAFGESDKGLTVALVSRSASSCTGTSRKGLAMSIPSVTRRWRRW